MSNAQNGLCTFEIHVTGSVNNKLLAGASVFLPYSEIRTHTDRRGHAVLDNLPPGPTQITIAHKGYKAKVITEQLLANMVNLFEVELSPLLKPTDSGMVGTDPTPCDYAPGRVFRPTDVPLLPIADLNGLALEVPGQPFFVPGTERTITALPNWASSKQLNPPGAVLPNGLANAHPLQLNLHQLSEINVMGIPIANHQQNSSWMALAEGAFLSPAMQFPGPDVGLIDPELFSNVAFLQGHNGPRQGQGWGTYLLEPAVSPKPLHVGFRSSANFLKAMATKTLLLSNTGTNLMLGASYTKSSAYQTLNSRQQRGQVLAVLNHVARNLFSQTLLSVPLSTTNYQHNHFLPNPYFTSKTDDNNKTGLLLLHRGSILLNKKWSRNIEYKLGYSLINQKLVETGSLDLYNEPLPFDAMGVYRVPYVGLEEKNFTVSDNLLTGNRLGFNTLNEGVTSGLYASVANKSVHYTGKIGHTLFVGANVRQQNQRSTRAAYGNSTLGGVWPGNFFYKPQNHFTTIGFFAENKMLSGSNKRPFKLIASVKYNAYLIGTDVLHAVLPGVRGSWSATNALSVFGGFSLHYAPPALHYFNYGSQAYLHQSFFNYNPIIPNQNLAIYHKRPLNTSQQEPLHLIQTANTYGGVNLAIKQKFHLKVTAVYRQANNLAYINNRMQAIEAANFRLPDNYVPDSTRPLTVSRLSRNEDTVMANNYAVSQSNNHQIRGIQAELFVKQQKYFPYIKVNIGVYQNLSIVTQLNEMDSYIFLQSINAPARLVFTRKTQTNVSYLNWMVQIGHTFKNGFELGGAINAFAQLNLNEEINSGRPIQGYYTQASPFTKVNVNATQAGEIANQLNQHLVDQGLWFSNNTAQPNPQTHTIWLLPYIRHTFNKNLKIGINAVLPMAINANQQAFENYAALSATFDWFLF